jgi:hypothetical protein
MKTISKKNLLVEVFAYDKPSLGSINTIDKSLNIHYKNSLNIHKDVTIENITPSTCKAVVVHDAIVMSNVIPLMISIDMELIKKADGYLKVTLQTKKGAVIKNIKVIYTTL